MPFSLKRLGADGCCELFSVRALRRFRAGEEVRANLLRHNLLRRSLPQRKLLKIKSLPS
jgi:hypothetical protein